MSFNKTYPKTSEKSAYPKWIEVSLTDAEEKEQEALCRNENIRIMKECINDAKDIIKERNLKEYQTDEISIATALFEKRSSHVIYWKESKAKEKFDNMEK
jgi:hypothetical protein